MRLWEIYHSKIPDFLKDAAKTKSIQKLQDIGMNCGCEYTGFPVYSTCGPYSRYDHSMGVALIVWHFTGDMAQAMAGLLHDISTPAFAHVVDFLRGDYLKQEATEAATGDFIRNAADLCRILKQYGLSPEAVEDYHRYPIADNDSPRLSADRLEYTLGNSVNFGFCGWEQAAVYYNDLMAGNNEEGEPELMFRNRDIACSFAMDALKCSWLYVSDEDRYAMQILSELLRDAIKSGILATEDLFLEEQSVICKLKKSGFSSRWQDYCSLHEIVRCREPGAGENWRRVFAKKRHIDPYVAGLGRVSGLFPEFCEKLNDFRENSQDYWICGVEDARR